MIACGLFKEENEIEYNFPAIFILTHLNWLVEFGIGGTISYHYGTYTNTNDEYIVVCPSMIWATISPSSWLTEINQYLRGSKIQVLCYMSFSAKQKWRINQATS